jgi:hypothetical protein
MAAGCRQKLGRRRRGLLHLQVNLEPYHSLVKEPLAMPIASLSRNDRHQKAFRQTRAGKPNTVGGLPVRVRYGTTIKLHSNASSGLEGSPICHRLPKGGEPLEGWPAVNVGVDQAVPLDALRFFDASRSIRVANDTPEFRPVKPSRCIFSRTTSRVAGRHECRPQRGSRNIQTDRRRARGGDKFWHFADATLTADSRTPTTQSATVAGYK